MALDESTVDKIIDLIDKGYTRGQIAEQCLVSVDTVTNYAKKFCRKHFLHENLQYQRTNIGERLDRTTTTKKGKR